MVSIQLLSYTMFALFHENNNHRKKCSTVIKLFKKKYYIFYPRLKKFFIWKVTAKSLSNCNRNFRGQPSGWIGWLLPSCTLCTYPAPIKRNLDKKRSSPIIILLYSVWYCGRIWGQQIKNSFFWQPRHHDKHRLSHLNNRYEPYIDRHLIYRHMVKYFINCVLVFD